MGNQTSAFGINSVYRQLLTRYGFQGWWPAESAFEMMTGAVLTQSAAWDNVAKAISNLKAAGVLSPEMFRRLDIADLARLIHPCGYYNAKAVKLKALAEWLGWYNDALTAFDERATAGLRRDLLQVHGIGPETADSILLYALDRPVFVIDAYTRHFFIRLGITPARDTYGDWQELFTTRLPADAALFNEYHALIVRHAKESCRKQPQCQQCLFNTVCASSRAD